MARTAVETIRGWLDRGKAKGATHMIVVCDTFSHEDSPTYVLPDDDDDVKEQFLIEDKKDMQRVMEVYNLSMDFEDQLSERRAFNF